MREDLAWTRSLVSHKIDDSICADQFAIVVRSHQSVLSFDPSSHRCLLRMRSEFRLLVVWTHQEDRMDETVMPKYGMKLKTVVAR